MTGQGANMTEAQRHRAALRTARDAFNVALAAARAAGYDVEAFVVNRLRAPNSRRTLNFSFHPDADGEMAKGLSGVTICDKSVPGIQ